MQAPVWPGAGTLLVPAGRDITRSAECRHDLRKGVRSPAIYAVAATVRCWVRARMIALVISAAMPGASISGRTIDHSRPPSGTVLKMG